MADARVPTLDEISETLTAMLSLAQVYVAGIKDRETLVADREATVPRLEAEIQAKVDRIVVLDRESRELQNSLVALRAEKTHEEQTISALRATRLSEAAQVDEILQELSSVEQRLGRRR